MKTMKERKGCQLFADTVFDPMEPRAFNPGNSLLTSLRP
jgi:hypothetical protein